MQRLRKHYDICKMSLVIWIIIGIIILIISRKLFFAGALGYLQYKSHVFIEALRLDAIPLVNLDFELSNIIMIFVTLVFGIPFAFFIENFTEILMGFNTPHFSVKFSIPKICLLK